ncbi:glycosyl hydrolase family 61-domain-containing protein [Elsinoe ampelina]|uniref:AA9 family lytic polysaccharide monooxygenase n=1 Tax=Elsinoe ampelina TaxID=302913 RepID=A0A6A6G154_9PEZI|nr:glycosyl hydrolase family 61-domain-containing protein [Elsinoe ampelina]
MKTIFALSLAALATELCSAHYTFDKLFVNDVAKGSANTYIRKHQNGYMPTKFKNAPSGSISPTNADFTCNKGSPPQRLRSSFGATGMMHPGPVQVYVTPVTNAASGAPPAGPWYKVYQALLCKAGAANTLQATAWCSWGEDKISFPIPATLPNGQYLARAEHIATHGGHVGKAEFCYACAQIQVTGTTASSIPGSNAQIPGVYAQSDSAVNFSVWGRSTSFDATPGPAVIAGGTIRGSPSGAGGDKSVTVAAARTSTSSVAPAPPAAPASSYSSVAPAASSTPAKQPPTCGGN